MSADKDLDDLLDSALKDFDEVENKASTSTNGTQDKQPITSQSTDNTDNPEDALLEQVKLVAERMNTLFGGANTPSGDMPPLPQDENLVMSGFKKIAEAAAMAIEGENPSTDEEVAKYSDMISQAIMGLQEGVQAAREPVSSTDAAANMFSALNLDGLGESDGNTFLPFMEGMMQSLLSAEILMPSIKELIENYPKFLQENADKISAEDKERYEKQLELYKVIEGHLQNENANDSPHAKREKFKVVLDDMRKLQEYGAPPEEIMPTNEDFSVFDQNMSAALGSNPQCPTM